MKKKDVGEIRRGEQYITENMILVVDSKIGKSKDLFKLLAHSIYGSARYRKLIQKCIWKYIDKYYIIEASKFRPHWGVLENGSVKWINSWRMFVAFIKNRDLSFSEYEINIVSILFDVTISIYKADNLVNRIWRSRVKGSRFINLCFSGMNEWFLLAGRKGDLCRKDRYETYNLEKEDLPQNNKEVSSMTIHLDTVDKTDIDKTSQFSLVSEMDNSIDKLVYDTQLNSIRKTSLESMYPDTSNKIDINSLSELSIVSDNTEDEIELYTIQQKVNSFFGFEPITDSDKSVVIENNDKTRESPLVTNSEGANYSNNNEYIGVVQEDYRRNSKVDSVSSISEDIKWLFEETDKQVVNNRIATHKRRKFWIAWKNKIRNSNRNRRKKSDKSLYKVGIQQKNLGAVFDYYSKGLTTAEIQLLSKGSTFCVVENRVELDRFKADIYAFSRRLRLHEEFRETNIPISLSQYNSLPHTSSQYNQSRVDSQQNDSSIIRDTQTLQNPKARKLPSTYDPDSQNRNLSRYCNCIQEEGILAIQSKINFKDNIDKEHRKALNALKKKVEDRELVITLADKGSGIVVVDYDKYISKGTHYIEVEAKAYTESQKVEKQIVLDIVKERNKIVKKLKDSKVIEVDTATYCMKQLEEKITGMKFYYKVHKNTDINKMPLRPLQSCIGAPTHHLSQVLTDILQPYLSQTYIPTFIQDSNQLLYRLRNLGKLGEDCTLISSDVAALYPSIPHHEGLKAVHNFMIAHSSYNEIQVTHIMKALELVITHNYVMWNNKIYKQDSGVAMGTPVAVAYANIFMDWIDSQIRQKARYIVEHIRYIDDNLFIIPTDKIEDLMSIANTILVPHIKFTYESLDKDSEKGLPFLDTQLYISNSLTIESRLYTKSTDKHTYLLPTSFHPSHITKNIPIAVFNRIRRICSRVEWFQADASLAVQWLTDRGYRYIDIKRAVENSSKKDRWDMINKIEENRNTHNKNNTKDKVQYDIPLIVTYNSNANLLKEVIKKRQTLLDACFSQTRVKPRVSFRRQKNLNDLLIQRSLRKPIQNEKIDEQILVKCGEKPKYRITCPCKGTHDQKICRCCAHLKLKVEKIETRIHKKVSCESKNLIYLLCCKICNKFYVGETQQQLKERFIQHLNNINKLSQPLYTHFNKVHKAENMYVTVLETVRSGDHSFRKIREAWWINKLQSLEPRGFNIKLECNQIYQCSNPSNRIER